MYKYDDALTNERMKQFSSSQFDLVNRAIKLAEYLIKSGKGSRGWGDNVAYEVLKKMSEEGPDLLEKEVYTVEA